MEEKQLTQMLETKARISINTKTGKHEFKYAQGTLANIRASNLDGGRPSGLGPEGYLQNSGSLVNFINDQGGGLLDQMAPIRPSNLIWQMPYDERKSFMNQQAE